MGCRRIGGFRGWSGVAGRFLNVGGWWRWDQVFEDRWVVGGRWVPQNVEGRNQNTWDKKQGGVMLLGKTKRED